jgi:hypothetical protein
MMRIRRVKDGVVIGCHFCKQNNERTPALWHLTGRNIQACGPHKRELEAIMHVHNESQRNTEYSEADHQTWMRL